jgi:hypothetical protein
MPSRQEMHLCLIGDSCVNSTGDPEYLGCTEYSQLVLKHQALQDWLLEKNIIA